MNAQYKFALHVLMFDCEKTILRMLDNCGPHVDRIFVTYSKVPWTYNKSARNEFTNSTDKEILKKSQYYHKIELIEGEWETDEDERNTCLKKVKNDGFDFLIIQDADEFFINDDYIKNIKIIIQNPDYELYTTPVRAFWKNLHYILVNNEAVSEFAINCRKEIHFIFSRSTNSKKKLRLPGMCYHLTAVLSDEEYKKKISHWGHSHQFEREEWFEKKWLRWSESTQNLHPLNPSEWKKAIRYEGPFPKELLDFEEPLVVPYEISLLEKIADKWYDIKREFVVLGKKIYRKICEERISKSGTSNI